MSTSDLDQDDLPNDEESPGEKKEEGEAIAEGDEAVAEEEQVVEEEQVEEEEVPEVLLSEDFISTVFLSEACTLPETFIEFDHSYGYDCKRYFNICVADKDTVIFASGNLIHFFNIVTKQLSFRRCSGGGGIGHITKHPLLPHIAIGENGKNPLIIIYEWPSMEIVCVLRDGTTKQYTNLDYSPDGTLLSSQGGDPDYMLTIWNWEKSRTMLRRKAYSQSVNNVMFSPYVPGQLSTGGTGHIRFWKIARTFTGLKLMGELGRFGKTEMSDIIGFLPLPDEKVVSGCEWGNMLVWDEGLIKVEVFRRGRKQCHTAPIVQFEFDNGELTTVGMDGLIKFWYFETIDQADPPDEDRVIEVEPLYEFEVGNEDDPAQLMAMLKRVPEDPEDSNWITQDGNGGIWQVQLDVNVGAESHNQILFCHAGPVLGIAASPYGNYLASIGKDGRISIYDYLQKKMLIRKRYSGEGRRILWLPTTVEKTGNVLVAAFGDGTIRVLVITFRDINELSLIQISKPHRLAITALTMNPRGTIIVTGGEDATVFIYVITAKGEFISLTPLGYIDVPSPVTFINWKPEMNTTAIICCNLGQFVEIDLPDKIRALVSVSYELKNIPQKVFNFKSVKSQIRRNIKLKEIEDRKNKKRDEKKMELEKLRAENPGLDIDEDTFLEDSDSEEELAPLFFPEVPNPILFAMYTVLGTLWLSMGGYDSGYIYEYDLEQEDPISCTMVADADDMEIHSYVYYHNTKYLVLGMHDGQIRVNRVNPEDFRDLRDYLLLAMHDNNNGQIHSICFSCDQRYMFSCGNDGNIFSYKVSPIDLDYFNNLQKPFPTFGLPKSIVPDADDTENLSLEETKQKLEYDRKMKVANERKAEVTQIIHTLSQRFRNVLDKNQTLAESQRLSEDELEIDPRITHAVQEILKADMDLIERKMAYKSAKSDVGLRKIYNYFINIIEFVGINVLAVDKDWIVTTFRNRHVLPEYAEIKKEVETRILWADAKGRLHERPLAKALSQIIEKKIPRADAFLKLINIKPHELKKSLQIRRMLNNYLSRRRAIERREDQWTEVTHGKPDPNVNHPYDVLAIELAEKSIGDYKLKSAEDYTVPKHQRITTLKKYNQMLETRVKIFRIKSIFNRKVVDLRKEKLALIEQVAEHHRALDVLQREVGPVKCEKPHPIPTMNKELELLDKEFVMYPGDSVRRKLRRLQYERKKKKTQLLSRVVMLPELKVKIDPLFEITRRVESEHKREAIGYGSTSILKKVSSLKFKAQSQILMEDLEKLSSDDMTDTPWEVELRKMRTIEKRGQQERLCKQIAHKIDKFDLKVKAVAEHKRSVEIKAKFIELHLLKLNQEMIILNKFEAREQVLSNKVLRNHREKNKLAAIIVHLQGRIDQKNKELIKLGEKENELTTTFMDAIVDSKFFKYLKKIYKKKYKPPKIRKDDDDSDSDSSSSDDSSSEDEDDARSIDSREIGPIRLDETIRPEGCEIDLYELAFELRAERHQVEIMTAEQKKQNELLMKELEVKQKHMKTVEIALHDSKNDLEAFQRVKQQRLNEVDVLIVMKLGALAHFIERNKLETLDNTLVFSKATLVKLNTREFELIKEMELHKEKYKKNRQHLKRMKKDCAYMAEVTSELNEEIVESQIKKFGCVLSLDDLEEALLRRMIARLRSNVERFRKEQDKSLNELKNLIAEKQTHWCCAMRGRTEKLNTLCALEKLKQLLAAKLRYQDEYADTLLNVKENPFIDENKKLLELVKQQALQIRNLKEEIRALSQKTKAMRIPAAMQLRKPAPLHQVESDESEDESFPDMPGSSHESDVEEQEDKPLPEHRESTEMYMQALLDEIMHALPEEGGAENWKAINESLQQGIEQLPLEDQLAARQMINEIIDKLPSYSGLGPDTEGDKDDLPMETVIAVRGILDTILDDLVGIRKIVEGIVDNIVPVEEQQGDDNIKQIISDTVEEIQELHSSKDEIHANEFANMVAKSLETFSEPDINNVQEIVHELLKTSILDKLFLGMQELDENLLLSEAIDEEGEGKVQALRGGNVDEGEDKVEDLHEGTLDENEGNVEAFEDLHEGTADIKGIETRERTDDSLGRSQDSALPPVDDQVDDGAVDDHGEDG